MNKITTPPAFPNQTKIQPPPETVTVKCSSFDCPAMHDVLVEDQFKPDYCPTCQANRAAMGKPKDSGPAQELVDGLMVSTDTLHYHLIPPLALRHLTQRIMLGEQIKGKAAWNALSDNQEVLESKKALARRLGHVISHTLGLLEALATRPFTEEDVKEASAVMWGGMYAICAIDKQKEAPNV